MEELPSSPKKKRNVPRADKDFDTLVNNVNAQWAESSWLTMLWLTQPEFAADVASYTTRLDSKNETASTRSGLTGQLKALDQKIDRGEAAIKDYLRDKYDTSAADHYAAFGIVHEKNEFTIPADRDVRKKALLLIGPALTAHGFEDKKFGSDYWDEIRSQYEPAMKLASDKDGAVSDQTGKKNLLKAKLIKALNAIISSIKTNYPDTWQQELRVWGFQKEKY